MVEFDTLDNIEPSGPCRNIMRREGTFIREMVEKTEGSQREYIANIVEIEGKMGTTDMRQGKEESILSKQSAQSMMDGMKLATEMKERPGNVNTSEYKRHIVHTHPNGFTGLSFADLKSFADDIVTGGSVPSSELVATMTEDGIWLGGIYTKGKLNDKDLQDLQSTLSLAKSTEVSINKYTAEMELLEAFKRLPFGFCSVLFPQR